MFSKSITSVIIVMTWVDYVIVIIVAFSAVAGLVRGLTREAISLFSWLLALWIAWRYFRTLAGYLYPLIESQPIRFGLAFFALFLGVLMLGGLIGWIIGMLVDGGGLSTLDMILGMFFGVLRGVFLLAIVVLLAGLTTLPQELWWQKSVILIPIERLAIWLLERLPRDIAQYFRF